MNDVARLLSAPGQGDPHAASRLMPLVYEELRKLAAQRMAQEQPGQMLQPTALVHEAYVGTTPYLAPGSTPRKARVLVRPSKNHPATQFHRASHARLRAIVKALPGSLRGRTASGPPQAMALAR
jgi:hypothetical protein